MLVKLVNGRKLGSVTSIGVYQYIIQKKIVTFKCQVIEMEFDLTIGHFGNNNKKLIYKLEDIQLATTEKNHNLGR